MGRLRSRVQSPYWLALLAGFAAVVSGVLMAVSASAASPVHGRRAASSDAGAVRPVSGARAHAARVGRRRKASSNGISLTRSATKPHWACPEGLCEAIVDPHAARTGASGRARFALPAGGLLLEGSGEEGGFDPQDLRSAYNIPETGGEGQTIALIDAFSYKTAETDLAKYRARYGLAPCTKKPKKDPCFRHVNQKGGKPHGKKNAGWELESSLDLDMASAACPHCRILLVDAENGLWNELAEAVNTAVSLGATEISNSYGIPEEDCLEECEASIPAYDHPGVMITVSAGDAGFDNHEEGAKSANFPATLPSVVAVGGTALYRSAGARGWSEETWLEPARKLGSGGGCAWEYAGEKPPWQADAGCGPYRTDNDVAAVAACETPLSIYDTSEGGWTLVCGTSASSPLVAGIEAHASAYARSLPGADAFYQDPAASFDVTSGGNGVCTPPAEDEYLCHAEVGYDGPTGTGTPDGPLQLTGAPPVARTGPPSAVTGTAATFNGSVEAQGEATSYRFEYGTSTSYGQSVPVPDGSASGTNVQAVSEGVTGLQLNTIYHYRLVASNGNGTSYGQDESFTTAAPVVTEISPSNGPTEGHTTVTITGANFLDVSAVSFGANGAEFTVDSETSITATAPFGTSPVDVTVTTPAGTSEASSAAQFSYELGPVVSWGQDEDSLGRGWSGRASSVPVEVDGLPEATALAAGGGLAAGPAFSVAALRNGEVMSWGEGREYGQLGNGTLSESDVPVHVCAVGVAECPHGPYLEGATSIVAGAKQTLALLNGGTVVAWGSNNLGQLGGGAGTKAYSDVPIPVCTVLETPCSPEHYLREVLAIAAGHETSYALLSNGTVMAWGRGTEGELGNGTSEAFSRVPVAVSGLSDATSIAAGGWHGLALLRNGTLVAWGWNEFGQLGDDTNENSNVPVHVCAGGGKTPCATDLSGVEAIAAGGDHNFALMKNETVMAWGGNRWGQLGSGEETGGGETHGPEICKTKDAFKNQPCSRTPIPVSGLSEVTELAAGQGQYSNTLAALRDGDVMSWGENYYDDLGNGTSGGDTDIPVHVCAVYATEPCPDGPYLSGHVTAMAAGGEHDLVSFAGTP